MLEKYAPILIFLIVAGALSVVLLFLGFTFGRGRKDPEKLAPYECGFEAFEDTRMRFDVRYYLVAILFIIFDLEIAFLFPWAVLLDRIGVVRPGRDGRCSCRAGGRLRLRVEERGARMGLSQRIEQRRFDTSPEVMRRTGFFVTQRRRADQLGAHRLDVADDVRPGLLRGRDDARRRVAL